MKTSTPEVQRSAIVELLEADPALPTPLPQARERTPQLDVLERARAFADPLLGGQRLNTGENMLAHADGVAAILAGIGAAPGIQAAAYLVYAGEHLTQPEEVIAKAFGESYAQLVEHTRKLVRIQRAARGALVEGEAAQLQLERVRKMLLAFSRDLRVVLLRLASRLQTLRWYAASRTAVPPDVALEARQVFAPLANRLGIWQIKWELEDLAFRFLEPERYKALAQALHEKRLERELRVHQARATLMAELQRLGLDAEVQGRPKHLYSIWKKMQGKGLSLEKVFDLRALRVVVSSVDDCYAVLARLHELYTPLDGEFDDYIARPKANGYQSLHTVVRAHDGQTMEVQIRTRAMHEHAEHGVAAHWAYKEAGAKGYAGNAQASDERVAEARKAVLRQLMAWERDLAETTPANGRDDEEARIFVFTPQAAVVELCEGATPIDFAYALHTELGHRIRGAKVDGLMVPLTTPLHSGQTVEVMGGKERGPSLDWLKPDAGYLKSPRSRAKVRAWFNALQQEETTARGREAVEKLLAREGKTAIKHEELAARLGFKSAEQLFEVVGKDEFSLKHIEQLLRPPPASADSEDEIATRQHVRPSTDTPKGGVLVVGVDSLLTQLARCCRPAPPDAICGYVTRGKGVAIHRSECANLRDMLARAPERAIDVTWGETKGQLYPVELGVEAQDRPGVLRDVLEVFAKLRLRVSHAQGATRARGTQPDTQLMHFTVEVPSSEALRDALRAVAQVPGVRAARRR